MTSLYVGGNQRTKSFDLINKLITNHGTLLTSGLGGRLIFFSFKFSRDERNVLSFSYNMVVVSVDNKIIDLSQTFI